MKNMTSRERLTRIFENKEVDRPALKLWGTSLGMKSIHPKYDPIIKQAEQLTDIFSGASSNFDIVLGAKGDDFRKVYYEDTSSSLWKNKITEINTGNTILKQVEKESTIGEPGFILEHFVKEPDDLRKILDLPYKAFPFSSKQYFDTEAKTADKGVTLFFLAHPGYAIQILTGSELLAYLSIDERDLLHEAFSLYSGRVLAHTKEAIDNGIKGIYGWVGPELLIPPLMSVNDFKDFSVKYDKKVCDEIHNAGGHVWVHCHGKVANLIDDFIHMGVDVLNPLEPPKNGDVYMEDIVKKYGNKIGLEGNIEIQDILLSSQEELHELIHSCVKTGSKSGRFILCPSAGFMEYPEPTDHYISNLNFFLNEGLSAIKKYR